MFADTLVVNGKVATHNATAIAIQGERILAVGNDLGHLRGPATRVIDAQHRTVIPGLIDAHTHFIRGGLTYTNEVRWDGLSSLAEALRRVRDQARRTPAPHWVQVIGGWTWAQFREKRFPTLDEINAATGDTPCMIMHLYDRAWVNTAGLRVLGWDREAPSLFGGFVERDGHGRPTGLVVSTTSLASLVGIWLRIPRLSPDDQINSTLHFVREHNRLGVTSVIDAGGGGQNYPDNYRAIATLAAENRLNLRIAYQLFAQAPEHELANYQEWAKHVTIREGSDYYRMVGAGEYILYAAGDPANFAKDWNVAPPGVLEKNLADVVKYLAGLGWPFRQHATFDQTARRILDVLEIVNRDVPLAKLRWGLDHCETLTPHTLERIAALGGHINIQNRMSLDGEAFLAKYGESLAADAPPIRRIRELGIPIACGTDGNRATSHNPWISLHWLLTGRTLGGAKLQGDHNLLDRMDALRLWTSGGAWMSSDEANKGALEPGMLADLVVLSADYFSIPVDDVRDLESLLTIVGGKVVYAAGAYASLDPPPPPQLPDWLPLAHYGGYGNAIPLHPSHPVILSESGTWSMECKCGGV